MTATQFIQNKFEQEKKHFSSNTDLELLRKDLEAIEMRITGKFETAIFRSESNLKSEINKLLIWLIATIFTAAALFIVIAKIFFNK